jgi:hypothetical protein
VLIRRRSARFPPSGLGAMPAAGALSCVPFCAPTPSQPPPPTHTHTPLFWFVYPADGPCSNSLFVDDDGTGTCRALTARGGGGNVRGIVRVRRKLCTCPRVALRPTQRCRSPPSPAMAAPTITVTTAVAATTAQGSMPVSSLPYPSIHPSIHPFILAAPALRPLSRYQGTSRTRPFPRTTTLQWTCLPPTTRRTRGSPWACSRTGRGPVDARRRRVCVGVRGCRCPAFAPRRRGANANALPARTRV